METDDLTATDWSPFGSDVTAPIDTAPVEATPTETPPVEEVTEPAPHAPSFDYAEMPAAHRKGAVPEALRQFLVEATATDYTPPFWVDRGGATRGTVQSHPGCPPIAIGGKALVLDDWGNPLVIQVTGMRGGEITGMLGDTEIQCKAWVALTDEAPLTVAPEADGPKRLTDEEADALDAEFHEWVKFLGWRADKYGWCGTFENILKGMGIKPWRPGFKVVTLQVDVTVESKDLASLVKDRIGGEAKVNSATINTLITLKDIDRDTFDNGQWQPLLEKAGYTNVRNIYVHSKEAMTQ